MQRPLPSSVRRSARGIILDDNGHVLLCHFRPGHPAVPAGAAGMWVAPGGGVEDGEDVVEALRRELREETGLTVAAEPVHVWRQAVDGAFEAGAYRGLLNDHFLVRAPRFEPCGAFDADQIAAEGIDDWRWWSPAELASSSELFSPRELPQLVAALVRGDVPTQPVTVCG